MLYHRNNFMENEKLRDNLALSKYVEFIYSRALKNEKCCLRWCLPKDTVPNTDHVNPNTASYLL